MKKLSPLFALIICGITAGCSSNNFKEIPYGCDAEESDPYCSSVENLYAASVENEDYGINVLASDNQIKGRYIEHNVQSQVDSNFSSNSENKGSDSGTANNPIKYQGQAHKSLDQTPVYTPESVHKLYRGPWRDDLDLLHSGEMLFYKTAGYWNFGTLKTPGSASGLLAPVLPDELGFKRGQDINKSESTRAGRHKINSETGTSSRLESLRKSAREIN